jgi:hypothetical protein
MRLLGVVCLVFSSVVWGQTYTISTIAGGGPPDNVLATSVGLDPSGIAVDAAGNVYFSNRANVLRLDAATGKITRVAGNGSFGYSGDGGPATLAALANPSGLAVDSLGNLYIATIDDDRVRKVSNSVITTFAGGGTTDSEGGPATSAGLRLSLGSSLAVDSAGNLYICESLIHRVRRVSNGIITTVVGKGTEGFGGDNGPALSASLSAPNGVAVDAAGNLYIADIGNGRVREVSNGIITTIAGGGNAKPGDGGLARDAALDPSTRLSMSMCPVIIASE